MSLLHLVGSIPTTVRNYGSNLRRHPNERRGRSSSPSCPAHLVRPHRRVAQPVRLCSGVIAWFIHLVSTNLQEAGENCFTPGWSTSVTPMMVR
jgi:hypothetical protein